MSKNYYFDNKLLSNLTNSLKQKFIFYLIYFLFILITIAYLISLHIEYPYINQHFSYLANSFLHGKLYFLDKPTVWSDTALFNGKHYWPLGPFPSVLLMPFVGLFSLFGFFFSQLYLQILFLFLIIFIIYQLCRRLHYNEDDSLIWSFAFIFSSMFFNIAAIHSSWFFSQVITVLLLFLFIYEFHQYNTEHIFRLALLVGLLMATRLTAGIGALVFLLLTVLLSKKNYQQKVASFIRITFSPILIIVLGLLLYNYLRFGNIFESGYSLQLLPDHLLSARNEGIFSFSHIPSNLYYALISAPLPVLKNSNPLLLVFPYVKINFLAWVSFLLHCGF